MGQLQSPPRATSARESVSGLSSLAPGEPSPTDSGHATLVISAICVRDSGRFVMSAQATVKADRTKRTRVTSIGLHNLLTGTAVGGKARCRLEPRRFCSGRCTRQHEGIAVSAVGVLHRCRLREPSVVNSICGVRVHSGGAFLCEHHILSIGFC